MKYIDSTPNESGAYQNVKCEPFPGCLPLTDGQAATLVQYNGFVTITQEPDEDIEGSSVTVTPNTEAWEKWKASQPDPEEIPPSKEEQLRADVDYLALMTGVDLV